MFDFVRTHKRLLQIVLGLLVFPSFIFFGVQGYSRFAEGGTVPVAKVDGRNITQAEWDAAHQRQVERMRQQMPGVDAKLFDSPEVKRETLEQMVRERVIFAAASRLNLSVGNDRLQRLFVSDPQYAPLRNADNTINKALLAAQGRSVEQFEASLRQELSLRQVLQGIGGSALASTSVANASLDPLLQRREIQVQRFDSSEQSAKVDPSDADVEAYYKSHEAQFRAPEQATIEYVVLDLDTIAKGIAVPEDEARKYYEENAARYTRAEERRASHILVKADKDLAAGERQKAKAKAEALLADLRKNPASFADVAKKNSDDPGSAERGGDLDFFSRGAMVKPFEDAVYAMKPGEISNIVETDFGYHIIKLTAVRGGDKKSFDAVRAEIEGEVKRQLAQKRYAEAAEQFTNTVYEQPDSLQPVIDKLKLAKQTATVQRTPAPGATGALASAKLLDAVFSTDAVRNKRNTDAVEVGPNQLASARIVQHTPARTLPLAEVKDRVRQRVVAEQASALARKQGQERLAQVEKGDASSLPGPITVSRNQLRGQPREVIDAALRADASKLPAVIGVDLGEQGYAVVRVAKVLPPDVPADDMKRLQGLYANAWTNAEQGAYYEALKQRYKAEIKVSEAPPPEPAASR
jgi:peptidyl-prolyl cis-trans isomerase D